MDTRRISMVSGTALLALTATASAGPMSLASSNVIAPPPTQTDPVAYRYRHHYRHYGWYHGRHYGRHYGWHHRYYHRYYGWNPGAAVAGAAVGLATVPFALATGGYYGYYPYYGYYRPSYYYY
jgi:hypothetical protein